jgi:hypothetical protein
VEGELERGRVLGGWGGLAGGESGDHWQDDREVDDEPDGGQPDRPAAAQRGAGRQEEREREGVLDRQVREELRDPPAIAERPREQRRDQ